MITAEPLGHVHMHADDLFRLRGGKAFDIHAALGAAHEQRRATDRVHGHGQVNFAGDIHGLLHQKHAHVVPGSEQFPGFLFARFRITGHPDQPGLAAPAP